MEFLKHFVQSKSITIFFEKSLSGQKKIIVVENVLRKKLHYFWPSVFYVLQVVVQPHPARVTGDSRNMTPKEFHDRAYTDAPNYGYSSMGIFFINGHFSFKE